MNVEIAERLAIRRREAGYSQEELAERLGVSRQAVSKWERSESSPDTDNLIALAKLYEVSLDDLLYVDSNIEDDIEFEAQDRAHKQEQDNEDEPEVVTVDANADAPRDNDDDSYVHFSWHEGINVKDNNKGDRVHVGWDGVHVVEGGKNGDEVHVGWDGVRVNEGGPEGERVVWTGGKSVEINGEYFEDWRDARKKYGDEWCRRKSIWLRFPFPLVVVIAYLLLGFGANAWATSWLVFFTIPIYYMLVTACIERTIEPIFTALYTFGATGWFLYMTIVEGKAHPTWIVFLTIPLVGWLFHALFGHKHRPKKENTKCAD